MIVPLDGSSVPPQMPNKLRGLADGDELYVVMVPLWCDDVSGNKSKQYNKHMNVYMVNSNLPGRLLQQEYFIRFVSASPHASAPEQLSLLKEQVKYVTFYTIWFSCSSTAAARLMRSRSSVIMLTPIVNAGSCCLFQHFLLIIHNSLRNHHISEVTQIASVESAK
jgi:hypothetical protein